MNVLRSAWCLILLVTFIGNAAESDLRGYLEAHCFDCHDSATRKGGLDLETLPSHLTSRAQLERWTQVHDRIASGEMPPKSREVRPPKNETAGVLAMLDDRLHRADVETVEKCGRSLLRRLTAQEYENALRDLLHLPGLRIKHLLPEDERRHGYNKIAQALDLSNVHLNQFMDAADQALASAIATRSGPPPVLRQRFGGPSGSENWNWVARGDAVLLKNKAFDPLLPLPSVDEDLWGAKGSTEVKRRNELLGSRLRDYEGAIGYFTGPIERTFSTSMQFAPVYAGMYRIRASAWGFWWDRGSVKEPHRNESFMLSVWLPSDGPRFVHSPSRRLGMFDVPSLESCVHEYQGWFDVNEELLFEIGTPTGYEKNTGRWASQSPGSCAAYSGPGIALDWFEVEGPVYEKWPPKSHTAIFGDLPIRPFASADGTIPPKRDPVRQRSRNGGTRPNNREITQRERESSLESVFSERSREDAARLLSQFLPRAFRRPVPDAERDGYVEIVLREMGTRVCFEDAMKEACKAALCSPDFLFTGDTDLKEQGVGTPRGVDRMVADRLALWFWNSIPDEELIRLAADEQLHLPENLQRQTTRLLSDARSDRFIADFTDQWLDLWKIDATQPDTKLYPEAREHLKQSMILETRAFFRELVTHNLSVTNLVKSEFAMINQSLAAHYGITGVSGCNLRRVPLAPDNPRGAFLTQAAVLKVTANGTSTSPVTRGAWINERILGNGIPPPPAGVPALDPDTRGAKTIREQLAKHRSDSRCAGCHSRIDPPGFALESFDVIGGFRARYRSLLSGEARVTFDFASGFQPKVRLHQKVDASGEMPTGEVFQSLEEFQQLVLRKPDALAANMVRQLLMYATGSEIRYSDRRAIARMVEQTRSSGHGLRSLIEAIVQSELFLAK